MDSISLENHVFRAYIFYSSLLILKVLGMVPLIFRMRNIKKIVISDEDVMIMKGSQVKTDDSDIERIRRAHLNDLENIPLFIMACFLYLLTKPEDSRAISLMSWYTVCRYAHTIVYAVIPLPQPTRAIVFIIAAAIHLYMVLTTVAHFMV